MKKAIIAVMLVVSAFAYAEDDFCKEQGKMASSIMDARQHGVPILRTLRVVEESLRDSNLRTMGKAVTEMAYQVPKYNLQENKQQAVDEFSAKVYLLCKKGSRK